ncbi:MAG: aminodeoxychorismate synthase component I [Candidatus Omnitrophica bacterium]|nr:aminodeoxychorismate synthase component I [Candidatus Omnitrophota bacterium]
MHIIPIIHELDHFPDPLTVYSAFKDEPYSAFLDSGMDAARLGRFSFIGHDPFMVVRSKGEQITVSTKDGVEGITGDPFQFLRQVLSRYKVEKARDDLPLNSGCIGYFSYDLRFFLEELPDTSHDDIKMPDLLLAFYDVIIIFDNLLKKSYISSSGLPLRDGNENRERAEKRLDEVKSRINRHTGTGTGRLNAYADDLEGGINALPDSGLTSNFSKQDYCKAIDRAKEYIACGDIYQVNLSQRFECDFSGDAFELYAGLRKINPAPFAAYLNFDDFKIVSSSPERFIKINGRYIETRPIKGTRPRGEDSKKDLALKNELLSSAKDRAEHLMIVDLERNDLGRVCEYGSVSPTEFMGLETYPTVYHLVSTVSGKLREGRDAVDCLKNCFPGGSITGAPKIRSMEIIEKLEPTKRGIYTGAIGYIDFSGSADLSIVIRTIVVKGKKSYFQVGGGIVADSDPQMEYQETLDKGRALAQAIYFHQAAAHSIPTRQR